MLSKFKISTGFLFFSVLVIGFFVAVYYMFNIQQRKYAYVELSSLYSEFSLTKKLESEFRSVELIRKNYLDSLGLTLNLMERQLRNQKSVSPEQMNGYENYREYIEDKRNEFEQSNAALKEKNETQIWTQINSILKTYGQENGYEFIFGLNGTGNIMYSKESLDITPEVVAYINVSYSGK